MNNYYVYVLLDPENDNEPYYIGKGKNKRVYTHFQKFSLNSCKNLHKTRKIKSIIHQGYNASEYFNILCKNLSESKALELETFVIETIGLENITNLMKTDEVKSGRQNPFYDKEHSEKAKEKMSKDKSKHNHPFWNRELSEEHRKNISKGVKSYERTEEHSQSISESLSGRNLSESHKESISESLKGREISKETRKKLSKLNKEAHTGKTLSESHKKSLSKAFSGEKNPANKLTEEEAREIKWLTQKTDKTNKKIADTYSVKPPTVSAIKNERNWTHIEPKKVK